MPDIITSQIIGDLQQDTNFPDWWKSKMITIPFFDNKELEITFMDFTPEDDAAFIKEADDALRNFLSKTTNDRLDISEPVYKNFDVIRNELDDVYWTVELQNTRETKEIWRFVRPTGIYIHRRPYGEHDIYVDISCECEWEEEHGLQLVFRQGKKLTRVSQIDGHLTDADAYDMPDEQDELLSAF